MKSSCMVPKPSLSLSRTGTSLAISWPNNFSGFSLESTPTLSPANWGAVQNPVTPTGNTFQVVVEATGQAQFFRLRK